MSGQAHPRYYDPMGFFGKSKIKLTDYAACAG